MLKKITFLFILLIVNVGVMLAQTHSVTGRVVDKEGEPVIGASVYVTNYKRMATTTNTQGKFVIDVVPGTSLTFSYIGMETVVAYAKPNMIVVMKHSDKELNEVVVNGYQEIKKARMTGSVSTIRADQIRNMNLKSMDQALIGTLPGVSAIQSGRPGEDAHIQIRGANSLNGNTEPIWIVDGLPLQGEAPNLATTGGNLDPSLFQSGIGNVSPDDIESITVLKDAAASAIYGARAANGVIVIKTKSGHAGRTNINVNAHFNIRERPRNNIHMMNSAQKIEFEQQSYHDYAYPYIGRAAELTYALDMGSITQEEYDKEINRLRGINTDWFKELYRPSFSTQVNASMSGGSLKTQFYTSLNVLAENGIELNNNYNRFRFNSKLNHKLTRNLRFMTELTATYRTQRSSASSVGPLQYALFANPYEEADGYDLSYDNDLSRLHEGHKWTTLNAKQDMLDNTATTRYLEAQLLAKLEWKPIKGLTISSQGVYSVTNSTNRTIQSAGSYTNFRDNWLNSIRQEVLPEEVQGSLEEGSSYSNSYTFRNTIEYNLSFKNAHFINFFAGQEVSDRVNYASSNYAPRFDQIHRIIGFPELKQGVDMKRIRWNKLGNTGKFESKLVSFYLNGSYSYKDRYVVSGSVRYDGSDIIGNKNQFTPLWNVSGKWNIYKESFFHCKFINNLAIRASYGFTGSIDKNALPFVLMRYYNSFDYGDIQIPTSFQYANPNVKWQTKRDTNLGFEASMWNSRINLDINLYNNLVFDLLDTRRLPLSSGRYNVVENVANLTNKGIEVDLSVDVIRHKSFNWNIRANMAYNKNRVEKTYYQNLEDLPIITNGNGRTNFVEGYPVMGWMGYKFTRVNPMNGHTMVVGKKGQEFDMDRLQNQALKVNAPTPSYLGEYNPPVIGGLSTSVSWDRLMFTINMEFRAGNLIQSFNTFSSLSTSNRHVSDLNRWRSAGDVAKLPSISLNTVAYSKYMYDVMLEKGDYIRSTFCSLAYNLPTSWVKKIHLQYARATLSANNLFTITAYKGIDPSLMGGMGYPNTRTFTISFNVGF